MSEIKCKFHNTGYCKYQEKCKFHHSKDTCETNCNKTDCNKRHPRYCKYGKKCWRNELCAYKHTTSPKESEELAKKILSLKTEIDHLKAHIEKQKEELKSIENDTNLKLDNLNRKVSQLEKGNLEKDTLIKVLRAKLKSKEESLDEKKTTVISVKEDNLKKEKELTMLREKVKSESKEKCDKCNYSISDKVVENLKDKNQVYEKTSKGPSLPGQIPDRSTTLPGGATVIPV